MITETQLKFNKLKRIFALIQIADSSSDDIVASEIKKFLIEDFEDTAADIVRLLHEED